MPLVADAASILSPSLSTTLNKITDLICPLCNQPDLIQQVTISSNLKNHRHHHHHHHATMLKRQIRE